MEPIKITDQIRKLITEAKAEAKISWHRICKLARISPASLSNFMSGRCGLSQETLDALGKVLGAKVTMDLDKLRKLASEAPGRGRPVEKNDKTKAKGE
ncbi:MAG: helix-turn-helix transcriptional regulator [Phycisphaerales bacterium]|nr:helix-turn-helix transcriptional regulator [Phycisphaerales bacterium]